MASLRRASCGATAHIGFMHRRHERRD